MTLLNQINWNDPNSRVTDHFTIREACLLPSWGLLYQPTDLERGHIIEVCLLGEQIRALFAKPLLVHCLIRPNDIPGDQMALVQPSDVQWSTDPATLAKQYDAFTRGDYNAFIGSVAKQSPHIHGLALDFSVPGVSCDAVRRELEPFLETWGFCMERIPGANWVHVDLYDPRMHGGARYFRV